MTTGLVSALRVPAELGSVGFVRSAFACMLERQGWPPDASGRALLASSEAVINAIEHGSPPGGHVDVELTVMPDHLAIRVTDEGRPGVPVPMCPEVAPPAHQTRGRGLVIIRNLADDFTLRPAGGGTEALIGFARPGVPVLALAQEARAA